MKKRPSRKNGVRPEVFQGDGFIIIFEHDYWLAHDPDDNLSGFVLYNRLTGKYHAGVSPIHITFPKFAKGKFKTAEDCPVDENHNPRGDFLMLLALRERFKEHHPGSDHEARSWREFAFRKRWQEVEDLTGKPVSESNRAHCMRIAGSSTDFETYVGKWLVSLVHDDNASEILIRLGKWMKHADEIESGAIAPHYSRFLAAVEEALENAELVVPCQKDVQRIYEKGLSANQLGKGHGFRSVMRQLHFDWLPAGKRGKVSIPKISGIKSRK